MCIFCSIINGDIPSTKVYEDDKVVAILDIAQATKGHTLVLPKKHYDNILECDDETLAHLMVVTKKLAKQITTNLKAGGCNILNNTNEVAGQSVMHLHVHILPRYSENDGFNPGFNIEHEPYDLAAIASEIKG